MTGNVKLTVTDSWPKKYRPKSLKTIVGQKYVVSQVRGMFKSGKIDNVLLITGPTGQGKTTLARIIAHMLNGTPYGTPTSDIQEANIGEDKGIDHARKIIQSAQYKPSGNYRVIILDEVHLLTGAAESAFLKPLEDTPPNTVYILCTNQPEKLLATLRGRSKILPLEPIKPKELVDRLRFICEQENVKDFDDKILLKIAENANGEPRSAISLLKSTVDSYLGSGEKDVKVALREAIANTSNSDMIAADLLIATYNTKPKQIVETLKQVKNNEYITLVSYMLESNSFLLDKKLGVYNWESIARKKMLDEIEESKVSGNNIIKVHDALVSIKEKLAGFMVPEKHLLLAKLSLLALEMRDKKKVTNNGYNY